MIKDCVGTMILLGLTVHDKTRRGRKIFSLGRRQKDEARMHADVPKNIFCAWYIAICPCSVPAYREYGRTSFSYLAMETE